MNTKDLRIDPIPAGVYYIGDPCYAFSSGDDWDNILEESDYFDKPMIMYKGHAVGAFSTAYGDGSYIGNMPEGRAHEFPVDSGLIGFVSINLMPPDFIARIRSGDEKCGALVEFTEPWSAASWNDGMIRIGHTLIDTDQNAEEDDDADERDQFEDSEFDETGEY